MEAKDLQPGVWYKLMDGDDWLMKFTKNTENHTHFSKARVFGGRLKRKSDYIDIDCGSYKLADMNEVIRLFPEEANFHPEIY